jgi:hypothetical protein
VITIPGGSTNVPFAGGGGGFGGGGAFAVEVGEKIGIGYGATYPCACPERKDGTNAFRCCNC